MKKKIAALVVAILGVLAVCDLTVFEKSNIKPVIEMIETEAREILAQPEAEAPAEVEAPKSE